MIRRPDGFALAGWLFADLFLALAVLFTVSSGFAVPARPSASPTPTPRIAATASPSPSPSATPSPLGISVRSICRTLDVSASGLLGAPRERAQAVELVTNAVARQLEDLKGGSVAIVLTFATASDESTASALSREVNAILKSQDIRARLGELFTSAQVRDYINLDSTPSLQGRVWMELFVPVSLNTGASGTGQCP